MEKNVAKAPKDVTYVIRNLNSVSFATDLQNMEEDVQIVIKNREKKKLD